MKNEEGLNWVLFVNYVCVRLWREGFRVIGLLGLCGIRGYDK